jgi:hypothetical protein
LLKHDGYKLLRKPIQFTVLFSSAAINQLNKGLACEWAKDNIRINCVAPWYTKTPLNEYVMLFHTFKYNFI